MLQPSLNNQRYSHLSTVGGFPTGVLLMVICSIASLTGCASGPSSDSTSQSPLGFSATPVAGAVALRWNAMGNGNTASKYAIERRSSTGKFVPLLSTKQTALVDADVQGNRAYMYRLVASSAPANPLESNLVFTPPEPAPGEVLFRPAVLNPVMTGQVVRLEALTYASQAVTWSVSPNTGNLVVDGRQVSFGSAVPGTYSLTATNTQVGSAQIQVRVLSSAQATILALAGPAFAYVNANADLRLSIGGNEYGENVTWKVMPSGPVIVRNGNAYVFIADQPGMYAIQAITGTSGQNSTGQNSTGQNSTGQNQSSETLNLEVRRSEVTGLQLRINPTNLEVGDVATLEPTFSGNGDFDRSLNWQITPNGSNNPTRNPPPRNSTYRFVAATAGTYSITAVSVSNPNQTANATLQVSAPTQTVTPSGPGAWGAKIDWPERGLDDKNRIVPIHAAMMPNGKVMTFGWSPSDGFAQRNDGAIWDPISGAFQTQRNPNSNIFCAGTSLLTDGRLFVAGGLELATSEKGIPDLNIFDVTQFEKNTVLNQEFSSAGWTKLTNMSEGRYYPSALTLGNGEVFISGGTKADASINRTSDLWKPNGQVVNLPNAARDGKRFYPMLFQGSDGSIFEVGPREGIYAFGINDQGSARELLDRDSIFRDYGSAVMYRPGRIVVIGGGGAEDDSSGPTASAKTINITDPNSLVVADTGSMSVPRRQHTAVLLANGQVLVVGGSSGAGFNNGAKGVLSSEVWDPIGGTFKTLASMTTKRMYHSIAILLPDARVLAAGGGRGTPDAPDEASGEVFSPPYLFNNDGTPAIRPVISSVPATVTYGTGFTIGTDSPNLSRATMVRLSSVTHSTNFDQRFIELPILSRDGNNLNVNVNSDRFVTQPGYYMVYVFNAQGVPSVSKIIQLQ